MTTFARFKPALLPLAKHSLHDDAASMSSLLIAERSNSKVRTYYAPFDHVNRDAHLVLVGITPGRTQMNIALHAAAQGLKQGLTDAQVITLAKQTASFGGSMKQKLVAMLDHHGFNKRLRIETCENLWNTANHLVHFTSALRNPVFVMEKGQEKNYTGGNPKLRSYAAFKPALADLRQELMSIPKGLIVPLGAEVAQALQVLVEAGDLPAHRVLNYNGAVVEFPHPSPANGESHALTLLNQLPSLDEYKASRLTQYRAEKMAEGIALTAAKEQTYLTKRSSYWNRARTTRLAIDSLA